MMIISVEKIMITLSMWNAVSLISYNAVIETAKQGGYSTPVPDLIESRSSFATKVP
jgi:hypothetical protein